MGAAEQRQREDARLGRRELHAEDSEDVEGGKDEDQHRRAANDVDIGAQRPAQRAACEGKADADEQADQRADDDGGRRDLDRNDQPFAELPAHVPEFDEEAFHWR